MVQWTKKQDTMVGANEEWAGIQIIKNQRKQKRKESEVAAAVWPSVHCWSGRMKWEQSSLVLAMEKAATFKRRFKPEL